MVWACGKNGLVSYGQKGVDGGSNTIIHFIETRLQYNWHNNKNTDGLVNMLASNLVILHQAHRVAWLIRQEKILK